jgi:hypothetical protein
MAQLHFANGSLGSELFKVKCDLSRPEATVFADYGDGFVPTQYQAADCSCRCKDLESLAIGLLSTALEMPEDDIEVDCLEAE